MVGGAHYIDTKLDKFRTPNDSAGRVFVAFQGKVKKSPLTPLLERGGCYKESF
jgi:hypothetical protein